MHARPQVFPATLCGPSFLARDSAAGAGLTGAGEGGAGRTGAGGPRAAERSQRGVSAE